MIIIVSYAELSQSSQPPKTDVVDESKSELKPPSPKRPKKIEMKAGQRRKPSKRSSNSSNSTAFILDIDENHGVMKREEDSEENVALSEPSNNNYYCK